MEHVLHTTDSFNQGHSFALNVLKNHLEASIFLYFYFYVYVHCVVAGAHTDLKKRVSGPLELELQLVT